MSARSNPLSVNGLEQDDILFPSIFAKMAGQYFGNFHEYFPFFFG